MSTDALILAFDGFLRTLAGVPASAERPNPGAQGTETVANTDRAKAVAALMRINHSGEVCAQGLYAGGALFARSESTRAALHHAAREELDHLAWCRQRLDQLNAAPSRLDPLWYVASVALGAGAGLISDQVSLGFVHATEDNVERHLKDHLRAIPDDDTITRPILQQMLVDEVTHGQHALDQGGVELPAPVRRLMWEGAKLMTRTSEIC